MEDGWTKRERTEFTVTFYGENESSTEVETKDIIACLGAITSSLEKANTLFNGKQSESYVKIKGSPKRGSLIIDLVTLLNTDAICAVNNLAGLMGLAGLITIGGGKTLFEFLKYLQNREIEKTQSFKDESGNDCVSITIKGDNNQVIVSQPVFDMYNDREVRREVAEIPSPMKSGLSKITFSQENNDPTTITKEEVEFFVGMESVEFNETSETLLLEIIQSRQDGSAKGWRFSTGDIEFSAEIGDNQFLQKIIDKKVSITHGDLIKAEVDIIQKQGIRLSTDRVITKVLSYNEHQIEKTLGKGQTELKINSDYN